MEFFLSPRDFCCFCLVSPVPFDTKEEEQQFQKRSCSVDLDEVERLLLEENFSSPTSIPSFQEDERGVFSHSKETSSIIKGTIIKHGPFRKEVLNVARLSRHPFKGDFEIRGKTRIVVEGVYFRGKLHDRISTKVSMPFQRWDKEVLSTQEVAFYDEGHFVSRERRVYSVDSSVGYFERICPLFS
ncbi:hypothetical protein A9K97_gp268 [Tokyovirus A1]|uniref:hypothetical protein n=1 Tax=Tokyovirus A1 TaxID=1826170 RepID=UPI0007A9893F|nr:hypothetical protein A9K97_gp268 [Tokyovirus A1]BAU80083.1 hypothetical protein [Tokyovirus A1]